MGRVIHGSFVGLMTYCCFDHRIQVCRERAFNVYLLPMEVTDAEYQFDRHKLIIYYASDRQVSFEFAANLFVLHFLIPGSDAHRLICFSQYFPY